MKKRISAIVAACLILCLCIVAVVAVENNKKNQSEEAVWTSHSADESLKFSASEIESHDDLKKMYKIETIEKGDSKELAYKKREKNVLVNQYYDLIDDMHEVDAKGELTYGVFDDYKAELKALGEKISSYGFDDTVERLLKSIYGLGLEISEKKLVISHMENPDNNKMQQLDELTKEIESLYHDVKCGETTKEQGWKIHDDIFARSCQI